MVTLTVDGKTSMRTSAVTLADEALSHFIILVSFMASFSETYPSQLVNRVENPHEFLQSPHVRWVKKLVKESHDADRVVECDLGMLEVELRTHCLCLVV